MDNFRVVRREVAAVRRWLEVRSARPCPKRGALRRVVRQGAARDALAVAGPSGFVGSGGVEGRG